ncbi:MAG: hypothetical protein DHS20C16_17140 [Phycisphaerae bacterium]|nr:MAG: hypothetical protein DHS20C16_17140 [Phycisphaerae bacterium]
MIVWIEALLETTGSIATTIQLGRLVLAVDSIATAGLVDSVLVVGMVEIGISVVTFSILEISGAIVAVIAFLGLAITFRLV